ncbi:hypothetical protein CS542_06995 [Pedobacter sp. IW39]|nr:hypothetical protein CS542_06995 [Pedobacter sp. IW39]
MQILQTTFCFYLLLLTFHCFNAIAQQKHGFEGTVKDTNGQPLEGAGVTAIEINKSAVTTLLENSVSETCLQALNTHQTHRLYRTPLKSVFRWLTPRNHCKQTTIFQKFQLSAGQQIRKQTDKPNVTSIDAKTTTLH